ncbi:putative CRISPR-associated protein [Caloranaerobacter azorensis]|uniref:Putative CRISPR-associated protein n=1 Tax=Caloranaerobacter azorensis TaxID=116090 RepID=A0A6P1YDY4_9FIRM|nr:putative CRISPR-associated protein [Caloranaerobacter azorensis]QIB27287.1 putative CRISPR-associated protein [Caloranaerobacter azorensis]
MKKVITTVGTSIISNYVENGGKRLNSYKNYLKESFENWEEDYSISMKKTLKDWMKKVKEEDISAEIKSLLKIKKEEDCCLEVYLITTDTVASNLCAQLIADYFEEKKDDCIEVKYNPKTSNIKGLQIENRKKFVQEGLPNLINRIRKIANDYYDNVIFNITGGYKGVIPYLTIMAAVNGSSIKYIFEESNELITIPSLPLKIDEKIFFDYYSELTKLEKGIEDYSKVKNEKFAAFSELEKKGLVEWDDEYAFLSPIGQIFFNRYRDRYFTFYCTKGIWEQIHKEEDILRIIKTKFYSEENRESKTEDKGNGHKKVYDDGNNCNRIFYFIQNSNIYIYKVFSRDHDKYDQYIRTVKFEDEKQKTLKNAKSYKIEKEREKNV